MTSTTSAFRVTVLAALAVAALGFQVSKASAYSQAVKQACTGDYLSFCSHTAPGSKKLRRCMRRAGPRLSRRCTKALVKAGLVRKRDRRRRRAARR